MEPICMTISMPPMFNKYNVEGAQIMPINYLIVYHGGCQDGTAAAAIFKHFLDKNYPDDPKEFIYGIYQEEVDIEKFRDKDVYFLDFSYPKEVIEKIIDVAWNVTILDHHKTAYNNLFPALKDKIKDNFNLNKCGAMLAWEFTHTSETPPKFLQLVNQRDMWQKEGDDADSLYLAISRDYQKDEDRINLYIDLINDSNNPDTPLLNNLLIKGKIYLDYNRKLVESIAYNHYEKVITDHNGDEQTVLVCNCQGMWASDVGEALAKISPSGISITWWYGKKGTKVSVRVKKDVDWDAGAYCKAIGNGGGHEQAAGVLIKGEMGLFI